MHGTHRHAAEIQLLQQLADAALMQMNIEFGGDAVTLASAVRAASARNCEILRSWRVISIADMLPAPQINDVLHRVTFAAGWESPGVRFWAVGISDPEWL